MGLKPRKESMAETREKLLVAGRKAFGTVGYTESSMDDFTAAVGLTRGALYHHFGDKKGLFQAVVQEIDAEMFSRLKDIVAQASTPWEGCVNEQVGYIEMALDPEIQRILFRDGSAILGDISQWPSTNSCIAGLEKSLEALKADGTIVDIDTKAIARLINGASSQAAMWIANSDNPEETSRTAVASFRKLLEGLRAR
jgi:AcrR family transcriptional regulator